MSPTVSLQQEQQHFIRVECGAQTSARYLQAAMQGSLLAVGVILECLMPDLEIQYCRSIVWNIGEGWD